MTEPTYGLQFTGIGFWALIGGYLFAGLFSPILRAIGERIGDAIRGNEWDDGDEAEEETLP
jgi:hypothetical protein